ncbi:hypothetical protein [Nonomuraea sediminis]|uniref:hypothetical protein n=1 Tax=Nonomuraea sediminis TaxID=2835864 RepID=UPI001BDCD237|nr:hypothetical protein [Nonomuraea sediminis]
MSDPTAHGSPAPPARYVLSWREADQQLETEYRYAAWAWQAARNLAGRSRAGSIQVVRVVDGVTVFDRDAGVDLPLSEW